MSRPADRARSEAREAAKPHCAECGRLIVVGAGTDGRWLCEYCLIIASFRYPLTPTR